MIDDIFLVYENCLLFNGEDSFYAKEAKKQRKKFASYLSKELGIDI
jgi:hypothetical protein